MKLTNRTNPQARNYQCNKCGRTWFSQSPKCIDCGSEDIIWDFVKKKPSLTRHRKDKMKYKCDNCKKDFEEGDEIVAVNNNVGGLSVMENTLSKKWVILCDNCFQEMKAQLVEEEAWVDLQIMDTDIKYFWHIGELQELLKQEDKTEPSKEGRR